MKNINLNELRDRAYQIAFDHGFHKEELSDEHFLMLVISELSEAVEADRIDKRSKFSSFKYALNSQGTTTNWMYMKAFEAYIKDSVEDKLTDAVIRLLDLAGLRKISVIFIGSWNADFTKMTFTEAVFSVVGEMYKPCNSYNPLQTKLTRAIGKIMAIAEAYDIDMHWHIDQKMKYNELREQKHGKKY